MSQRVRNRTRKPASAADAVSSSTRDLELEKPIVRMLEGTNHGNAQMLLSAFADDAVLIDWGRTFAGKEEIARWNADENIGTKNNIRVTGVDRRNYETKVDVVVSGDGYNGPGVLSFLLDGDEVKRLRIT